MMNYCIVLVIGVICGIGLVLVRCLVVFGWSVVGIVCYVSDDFFGCLLCCDLVDFV